MNLVSWQRTIDQIVLTGADKKGRVTGLTALRSGSGVSLISRYLARTLGAAGSDTLLLNLSKGSSSLEDEIDRPVDVHTIVDRIEPSGLGFDLLEAGSGEQAIGLQQLKRLLADDLESYSQIILDMPPVLNASGSSINSVAAAGLCDRLVLVTRLNRDKRAELTEVVSLFREAGIQPSAILANKFR